MLRDLYLMGLGKIDLKISDRILNILSNFGQKYMKAICIWFKIATNSCIYGLHDIFVKPQRYDVSFNQEFIEHLL